MYPGPDGVGKSVLPTTLAPAPGTPVDSTEECGRECADAELEIVTLETAGFDWRRKER